mmetsp:Transcript_113810/g.300552  ORF Transcript_113810/g.300552 Transcript_113810/m.300552 type:complete len:253 (+) Transcript_113810:2-760(+)
MNRIWLKVQALEGAPALSFSSVPSASACARIEPDSIHVAYVLPTILHSRHGAPRDLRGRAGFHDYAVLRPQRPQRGGRACPRALPDPPAPGALPRAAEGQNRLSQGFLLGPHPRRCALGAGVQGGVRHRLGPRGLAVHRVPERRMPQAPPLRRPRVGDVRGHHARRDRRAAAPEPGPGHDRVRDRKDHWRVCAREGVPRPSGPREGRQRHGEGDGAVRGRAGGRRDRDVEPALRAVRLRRHPRPRPLQPGRL